MRKGHLDASDLEKYRKADLQALARELGVSDEGTIREIAARCAAVEVDIPDDDQEPGEAPEGQDAAPESQGTAPDGTVMVAVVQTYYDLELERIVKKGESLPMKAERAAVIIGKALGEAVEE